MRGANFGSLRRYCIDCNVCFDTNGMRSERCPACQTKYRRSEDELKYKPIDRPLRLYQIDLDGVTASLDLLNIYETIKCGSLPPNTTVYRDGQPGRVAYNGRGKYQWEARVTHWRPLPAAPKGED